MQSTGWRQRRRRASSQPGSSDDTLMDTLSLADLAEASAAEAAAMAAATRHGRRFATRSAKRARLVDLEATLDATKRWKPWLPPKSDQGLQQGGAFVFEGDKLLFQHYDPSTGAHVDLDDLLRAAVIQ